ncbi:uncharacterized protein LACBIDRAFT_191118 [Laccaria bicolor S238N-H82]|uniref:Predicted protein n=1 Tax=Laccaria bicolor (strain S238N-H82 / ATCC MYA-4686) TaxID=486041 RepID=B0DI82_LACBS|nr:uncharacterized protein LACBIDRAFT_191118 [Laccaria bicolor S238N-H82]EDR05531.1 predicted protein [Laccaria bicolor S238N-H82]|eukprot:XP_001883635.1 predicted protein [Laccaria bicolor S238N-H82]
MAGASGGALAAQVTLAGGFGFLAAGYDSPEKLQSEIDIARSLLKLQPHALLPVGVGFLAWQLESPGAPATQLLSVALDNNVRAIWLAFGNNIKHWVDYIHEHNNKRGHTDRVLIFCPVSSVEQASVAVNEWCADVIIVQGVEAGGHGASQGLPLLTLLPLVTAAIGPNGPPILGAGGLVNGAHAAALLTLGASGVVLGTRLLLSPESLYTDAQRRALIEADSSLSVRTMAFDYARNTLGWPQGVDGRGLRNATVEDYERGEDIQVLRSKLKEASLKDDTSRIVVWAGASVGLVNKIMPAREIVEEIHKDCVKYLRSSALLVSSA